MIVSVWKKYKFGSTVVRYEHQNFNFLFLSLQTIILKNVQKKNNPQYNIYFNYKFKMYI